MQRARGRMNQERMLLHGQLAEAERAMKTLEREADGQVLLLRMRSLPTLALGDLRTAEILAAAESLHRIAQEAAAQREIIAHCREALGLA
ncbi:MAG: hypothetical protein HYY11_02955 [Candidatus Methylomirabilis oxyfera]|nr:hypothetical protein [Candidatus Methylomirabilis oxyfera]